MNGNTSSSSEESDAEDQQNNNMKTLADLMWQKLKNDKQTRSSRPSATSSDSDVPPAVKGMMFSNLSQKLKTSNATNTDRTKTIAAKPTWTASSSSSSSGTNTIQGIKALHQKRAEEALKEVSTKTVGCVESERQKKKQAKLEKGKWKYKSGSWGAMKVKEQTDDDKRDLAILSMRGTIDPTRHYKHNDLKAPKFFQIGTVEESPASFYTNHVPKKKRKRTLLDELMADEDFKRKTKQRYNEVMAAKSGRKGLFHSRPPQRIGKDKFKKKRRK